MKALFLTLLIPFALNADTLHVLAAGASKATSERLFAQFEKDSGHIVKAQFMPMGQILALLAKGEKTDLVIVSEEVAQGLSKEAKLSPGSARSLVKTGVGVAIRQGAKEPDIKTAKGFKNTLLAAKSIIMVNPNTGTSGKHLAQVFKELGIADVIAPKLQFKDGGYVVEAVGRGEVEIGLHQITEILPVPNVRMIGPLPEAVQKWTVYQSALLPAHSGSARALQDYLHAPAQAKEWAERGFLQP